MSTRLPYALTKSLGELLSWSPVPGGLSAQTSFGNFRVLLYGPGIARITATRESAYEDFSYAVIAQPTNDAVTIEETENAIDIRNP